IDTPIRVTKTGVDPDGLILVLAGDGKPGSHDKIDTYRADGQDPLNPERIVDPGAALRNNDPPTPLAIRGDVGDCLAITLTSEECAGTEFVQSRWYLDEPLHNIYFHDHTDGIHAWQHGAVGQLVVEPKGATFHDPTTGEQIRSGPLADIRVDDLRNPQASVPGINNPE